MTNFERLEVKEGVGALDCREKESENPGSSKANKRVLQRGLMKSRPAVEMKVMGDAEMMRSKQWKKTNERDPEVLKNRRSAESFVGGHKKA